MTTQNPAALGSSPRIRGECMIDVLAEAARGIIPANTGRIMSEYMT